MELEFGGGDGGGVGRAPIINKRFPGRETEQDGPKTPCHHASMHGYQRTNSQVCIWWWGEKMERWR